MIVLGCFIGPPNTTRWILPTKVKTKVKLEKMATPEITELSEEKIDCLAMRDALKICRKHGINLSDNPPLPEIKHILKLKFLCQGKSRNEVCHLFL